MKKDNFLRCIAIFCIAILALLFAPELKAQGDILDECPLAQGKDDCLTDPPIEIPVNFDGLGNDTLVIIDNISGKRLLNPTVPDKQYKFCAANNDMCGTPDTDPGEFHIRFKYNSAKIGVNKISFEISNNSGGTITVTAYQGLTDNIITGTAITGGLKYVCDDNITPFDSIVIVSGHDPDINLESELFILDSLFILYEQPNQAPTDISLSSNTANENEIVGTTVGSFSTTDPDAGDSHTYSLVAGAGDTDNTSFTIAISTLQTAEVFDYETQSSYSIRVQTDDGNGGTFSKEFTININDVIEVVSFNINAISNVNVNENTAYTSVTPSITGLPIGNVSYSKGGTDAADFTINPATGVVSMVIRDYENPVDENTDNVYEVTIIATDDDSNSDSESWTVTVNDVIEPATFTIDAISDDNVNENTIYTSVTPNITGVPIGAVNYTLAGTDAADFTINPATGVVNMVVRDYENPVDENTDNVYEVTITSTDDDNNSDSESWTVTVNDVIETATFNIDNISDANVNENTIYTSVTPNITGAPIGAVNYTLGGTDATDFTINPATGVVSMVVRDYENPVDANTDNVYIVSITATDDDNNFNSEGWTVTVDDVIETASFTINAISNVSIDENTEYTSVIPNITGIPIGFVTYSLGGADAADFGIDASTGVVTMVARDYENPVDANTDNVYEINITATDADDNSDSEDWTVTVNDVGSEGPPEVVCLMDLSYSMNRDFYDYYTSNPDEVKLTHAKSALIAFSDLLYSFNPNEAALGLARFPNSPQVGCDAGSIELIQNLSVTYNNELATDIPLLVADGGSTPLLAGLDFAIDMFNSDNQKVIVLLSDGRQNCPTSSISGSITTSYINALNTEGITLYTIGFGANTLVPNDFLNMLATGTTNGAHYNVAAVSDKSAAYDPNAPDTWDPGMALHATYANIMVAGLGLDPCTDPLDIIDQGIVKQFEIPVTLFDNKVCFFVSWVTPQLNNLGVKIYTSDGNELQLDQPGIIVIRRKNHAIITISKDILNQEGMLGNWTLEIDGSNITNASEHYQYSVINSSKKLTLNTWFEKERYFTGDEMKIFLELLVEDNRLTNLDSIFIKGTCPGEGLGSWLVSKKVTKEQLIKVQQPQLNQFMKRKQEQPQFKRLNTVQKQKYQEAQRKNYLKNIDPVHLRAQVLMKEFKIQFPKRIIIDGLLFNDEGTNGDEESGDGIYTTVHEPLIKEGSYQFYFTVIDTSKGKDIQRDAQLQKYVNVKIGVKRFIESIELIDTVLKGEKIYNVFLILKDKFGNVPSPSALIHVNLSVDKGKLIGGIQANPDGTFTQMVSLLENVKPRQVKMTMNVYEQVGEQRLASRVPGWIYIIIVSVILIIIGVFRRMRN